MAGLGLMRPYVWVLLYDAALWVSLWAALVLLRCSDSGGLGRLWSFSALRWALLHCLSLALADGNKPRPPVLHRWVAALCLLPPLFESGRAYVTSPPSSSPSSSSSSSSSDHLGPLQNPGMAVLALLSATMACLAWETGFPDRGKQGKEKEKEKEKAWALLMRVGGYFRPDTFHLAAAFLFLILGVVCETFIPYYQGKVIDLLSGQYQNNSFMFALGSMGLVSLGSSLCSGLRGSMFMVSLCRLNRRMRHMLFSNLVRQDIPFFEENKPGSLTSRLTSDVDKMGRSVALNVNVLVRSLVKTLGMLLLMLGLSWELTLLTCAEMPLNALLQNTYNTYGQALKTQLQDCQALTKELASQSVGAMRTVRSFRGEEKELQRYSQALEQMNHIQRRKGIFSAVVLLVRRMVTVGLKVAMLLQGRRLISSGQLTMGSLLAFVLYQKDMVTNMRSLVYIFGDMLNTVGAAAKVFTLLDRKPNQEESGQLAPDRLEGRLALRDVTFSYPSRPDTPALKSVTLELQPGKMTALVGPSGGGKSSCVSLLQRFYEPQEGQVLLDGQPLHCYQHHYLHQKMALVSQDPVLFSGSVRHNVAYGLRGCSLERVTEAAKRANAHSFICDLEHGYLTDVGECGGQLAAGQKQCIAIARALVRQPQILLLDEATNCLDVHAQHAVQSVLAGSAGQTVLVVAHRLETVERADHILFMDHGVVVEEGTHQQLMAKRGRYHRLKEELFN